ncbi:uncharacterized protein LOC120216526 [Hibiscus syriacus]|uniref:uncharacterized protein LOC120216526 n=1 Tax=Hibiscus syriacus TaxID=106335 RepID=UPI001925013B|nr:uncharacterized protein LOC120216526 [Hibiscus syriacus]
MRAYVIENADLWKMIIPTNVSWCFKYILKIKTNVFHLFASPIHSLSVRSIREDMHISPPKVSWKHLVWFPGRIPKHNIIVWMAILNRLPTPVRLLIMGLNIENDKCLLCGIEAECRDHLFFGCNFAKGLWGAILALCGHVYGIWKERNNRLYGGRARPVHALMQDIKEVRIRMEGNTISRADPRNATLCVSWGCKV